MSLLLFFLACADPGKAPAGSDGSDTGGADTGEPDTADPAALVEEPMICDSPGVTLTEAGAGYAATTDHYQLEIVGFDAEEAENLAALAETSWAGLAAFFGAEAPGPLAVRIAADAEGFAAMLAEDGIKGLGDAGGYYDPNTGRAYLYRQPTAYYSRVLLLHELVHQYQHQAGQPSGLPFWYVEGLAEALSRHHWDGRCAQLRVRPLLSWEDAAAQAQAELDAGAALGDLLSGASGSRALAQELVRLLTSDPALAPGFAAWRASVAAGASPTDLDALAAAVGDPVALAAALDAWVPADQEPMAPIWLDWIPEGAASARGFAAGSSSAARVKGEVQAFAMAAGWPAGGANVGVVYGYDEATGDVELAFVDASGAVSRFAVIGGAVAWDIVGSVSPAEAIDWSHEASDASTVVTVGGEAVDLPRALPPAGGLALYDGEATYTAIEWR